MAWAATAWLALASAAGAQEHAIAGAVRDPTGAPLAGATVMIDGGASAVTAADGAFRIAVAAGSHRLRARLAGYREASLEVAVVTDLDGLDLVLEPALRLAEEVVVTAIRADSTAPVSKVEIDGERIERRDYAQEMPFLLAETPGVTSYSESGLQAGAGYSYFSLRGMHQTRVNMTLDGVPLNDPEESAVYFANFGDFTSALGSIQVQRGVGTSSVGAASYGGSIDFESRDLEDKQQSSVEVGGGSYGTERASLAWQSGRRGRAAFQARATWQRTDGYREHSGVEQRSLYWGGDWLGDQTYVKAFGFFGREKTELAFDAVEPEILRDNPRFNPLQPDERDDFGQDLAYVQVSRPWGPRADVAGQVYYNGAQGHFDLWDDPEAKLGLRRYAIDGETVGALLTTTLRGERFKLAAGLHGYRFARDHFQDLDGERQYDNTGRKQETSGFVKLGVDVAPRWNVFADLQARRATFRYDGSVDLGPVSWSFANPKVGVRYALRAGMSLYASYGRAGREPVRNDLLVGEDNVAVAVDLRAVRSEEVRDAELGLEWSGPRHRLAVDLFDMRFRDEIAPTGEQSEIGYAIRRNIPRSSRRGLELDWMFRPGDRWRLETSAFLARHRIETWRQVLDVYDEAGEFVGSAPRAFTDTPPALSPETILRQGVEWQATPELALALAGRYVGKSFLDNTGQEALSTPSYTWIELAVRADLGRWIGWGRPRLRLEINNLLDRSGVWPSGYSYPYLVRGAAGDRLSGIPYYYPLAGRNLVAGVEWTL
jgi:iron complex outermembrane receptor protein